MHCRFRLVTKILHWLVIISILLTSVPAPVIVAARAARPVSTNESAVEDGGAGSPAVDQAAVESRVFPRLGSAALPTFQSPLATPEPVQSIEPGARLYAITNPPVLELGARAVCTVTVVNEDEEDLTGLTLNASLPTGLLIADDPSARQWQATVGDLALGESKLLTATLRINGQAWDPFEFEIELRDGDDDLRATTTAIVGVGRPGVGPSIPPEGGAFSAGNGRVRAEFPAGAVDTPVQVSARVHRQGMVFDRQKGPGQRKPLSWDGTLVRFEIEARDEQSGEEIESFGRPVTLTVDLRGLVGEEGLPLGWDPVLYYLADPENGLLEEVPVTFDPETGTFTARLEHFSTYTAGAAGEGWEPLLTPPAPDLFSGAATYQYPIEMPAGRNGLQPQVSLVYNSRNLDGLVTTASVSNGPIGLLGWTVGGIAGIVRSTKVHDNGKLTIYDEYSLTLNGTSHELEPATTNPCGRYYARNAPGLYVERRNAACGNGSGSYTSDYWIVRQPDGTKLELGSENQAQTRMYHTVPGKQTSLGFCVPDDGRAAQCATNWQVNEITDVWGNRIKFLYVKKAFEMDAGYGEIGYQNIRVAEVRYNNYDDNGTEKWLSKATFRLEHDDPTKLRFDTIHVYHADTELRRYDLNTDVKSKEVHGHTTRQRILLDIQEYAGGSSLPKTEFVHEGMPNGANNGYHYWRIIKIENGYGGRTEFSYAADERSIGDYHLPSYGYSYWVTEVRSYDGMHGTTPSHVTQYDYGTRCYDQLSSNLGGGVKCQGRRPSEYGPLVGHDWVQETSLDFDSSTPLVKTKHYYYSNYATGERWRRGREYQTQVYSGQDELLNQTDTTWAKVDHNSTIFTYVSQVVTTDHSGGTSVSTRVAYEYDGYGNILKQTEYDQSDDPHRQTVRGYYPNTSAWIVNKPGYENVRSWEGASGWVLADSTWYAYDGHEEYDAQIGSKGELTAVRRRRGSPAQYPNGHLVDTVYTYDGWGNRSSETTYDGYGDYDTFAGDNGATARTTEIHYDETYHLYPLWTRNALDQYTHTEYYGINQSSACISTGYYLGAVCRTYGPNGTSAATRYAYDSFGRLTAVVQPLDTPNKPTTKYTYYDTEQPLRILVAQREVSGASGVFRTVRLYDGLGRVVQERTETQDDVQQAVTNVVYDALGRVQHTYVPAFEDFSWVFSRPAGWDTRPRTTTQYDALGRTTRVTNPDGTYARTQYNGLQTTVVDENGHQRRYTNDAFGRLIKVEEFEDEYPNATLYATTHYVYDVLGNLKQVTDALGNLTTMQYDPLGRKEEMSDPDMGHWYYQYDAAGNLKRQRDARGQRICFYYDPLNRLTGKHYRSDDSCPSSPTLDASYTYDQGTNGIGHRTRMDDGSGYTTWTYDVRGRMTEETKTIDGAGTFVTGYTYDAMDRVVTMTYPDGEVVTHAYNDQRLLDSVSGNNAYVQGTAYDASGRVELRTLGNDIQTDYVYYPWTDQNGRLKQIWTGTAAEPKSLQSLRYYYDAVGNVTRIVDWRAGISPDAQINTFGYDALDRLETAGASGGIGGNYSKEYLYDEIGNINTGSGWGYYYSADHPHAAERLEEPVYGGTIASYSYDANGNMTGRTENSDTYTQVFNAENKLDSVTVDGEMTTFVYDGDGNRVKKVESDGDTVVYVGGYYEVSYPTPTDSEIKLVTGKLTGVGSSWQTVVLPYTYDSMVVVAAPNYDSGDAPAVVRIRNASGNSFQIRVQNPSDQSLSGYTVHYLVVEEGVYTQAQHGIKMEAKKYTSTRTDENNSWVGQSRSYQQSYSSPVVLGQVMTANDADWSVFWARGSSRSNPPTGSYLYAGKHVGADSDTTRANETIGYVVIEAGSGNVEGVDYVAGLGADTVQGVDNAPPYNYAISGPSSAGVAVASAAAMDGGDGGWPVLHGNGPVNSSQLKLAFDEDQIADSERAHTTEQVAYVVFAGEGIEATKYYYAAGQRVAMNRNGVVQYLHADHLGSTTLATDASGAEVSGSRTLYYPYGKVRWSASGGTLATDYGFTGQRHESFGLMDYNARYYDPYLNRFISPDTIIPNPANPQSFNRYSYVVGNPLKYRDPTGHWYGPDEYDPAGIEWDWEREEYAEMTGDESILLWHPPRERPDVRFKAVKNYAISQHELVQSGEIDDLAAMENIIGYAIKQATGDVTLGLRFAASSFYRREVGWVGAENYDLGESYEFGTTGFHNRYVGHPTGNENQIQHFIGEAYIAAAIGNGSGLVTDVVGHLVAYINDPETHYPRNDPIADADRELGYVAAQWVGLAVGDPGNASVYLSNAIERIRTGE